MFDGEKLRRSVEVAAMNAGLAENTVRELVDRVLDAALKTANDKEEISTSELGECVFNEMRKTERRAAEIWKNHEEEKLRSIDNPFISRGNNYSR